MSKQISPFLLKEWLSELQNLAPTAPAANLEQLLSAAFALVSKDSQTLGLPDFPIDNLTYAAKILVKRYNFTC